MKKIFSAALAAVMTVSLASVAFADTTTEMGFVLGYKEGSTPGTGTTVYADQDDDGNFDETTLAALGTLGQGFVPGLVAVIAMISVVVYLINRTNKRMDAEYALGNKSAASA